MPASLSLSLRRRALTHPHGYATWRTKTTTTSWPAGKSALVLCDVWDHHTCRGAEERLARLIPRMGQLVTHLRDLGTLVIHAPSDTIPSYEGTQARSRAQSASQHGLPPLMPQEERRVEDPPQPVDQADPCDTCPDDQHPKFESGMAYPWTREHPGIHVDQFRDAVSADGHEHLAMYRERGIEHVLLMGVHTNMCILRRTFSIKQMVRWGVDIVLIRDLTDAMYNPARPPYVSHDQGTQLIVEYIEKFWCPTVTSEQILGH
ncbi:MAG: isochorismatase family protein [Chloroflexota bacterium]